MFSNDDVGGGGVLSNADATNVMTVLCQACGFVMDLLLVESPELV